MKTLIIDNYDSFSFNLFQYIGEAKGNPVVIKNNEITIEEIQELSPSHLVISPGPGTVTKPKDFGICSDAILYHLDKIPILGVCLGHQGIANLLGAKIINAPTIMHGKQSKITHNSKEIFEGVNNPFTAMRYHSLCVSKDNFPKELEITAYSKDDNTIMGIQHSQHPVFGIQFHPESFGTPEGKKILNNFLSY